MCWWNCPLSGGFLFSQRYLILHSFAVTASSSSIAVLQLKGWPHVWPFSNCPCPPQILLHRWSAVPSSHWCLPSIVSLVAPYLCSLERSPVWCPSLSNLLSSLYVHSSSASMFLCELTVTPLLAFIVPIRLFCDLSMKLSILFGSTTCCYTDSKISGSDTGAIQHFGQKWISGTSLVLGRNMFHGGVTVILIPLSD